MRLVVSARSVIDLDVTIDCAAVESETTCSWSGAHVLTLHTVIARRDLALELHSTFVGHPGVATHVVHLALGPPGRAPSIVAAVHDGDGVEPTYAPRLCAYEHAQRLIEILAELGMRGGVQVPDDRALEALERATF